MFGLIQIASKSKQWQEFQDLRHPRFLYNSELSVISCLSGTEELFKATCQWWPRAHFLQILIFPDVPQTRVQPPTDGIMDLDLSDAFGGDQQLHISKRNMVHHLQRSGTVAVF